MFLNPKTTLGFDDIAIFNNEQKLVITAPSSSNAPSMENDDMTSESQALVPINVDEEDALWNEADDSFIPSDADTDGENQSK